MEKMPLFIKIENYEDVLDIMNMVKAKVAEVRETFTKLEEVKSREEEKMNIWNKNLEEIESKLNNMDRMLFEPEN